MTLATDSLELADWRRRISELYAEVRRVAATDPLAAHGHWRAERERLYREHPQSPVPVERRTAFHASHFLYDPALRFELPLLPADEAPQVSHGLTLPSSAGASPRFDRIGRVEVPVPGGTRHLSVFWLREYSGGLFLPFADVTSGRETYGSGRYVLDGAKGADLGGGRERGTLVIDFNFSYQPSCAFESQWTCPLAPAENRLDVEVRAGERIG